MLKLYNLKSTKSKNVIILKDKIVRFLQGFNGILEKIDKIKEFREKAWLQS